MSGVDFSTVGAALLFCPADRPDRFHKAIARADAVILDLEDAVLPPNRAAARDALLTTTIDPTRTIVRVNPVGTTDHEADIDAVLASEYRTVMLAKAESAQAISELSGRAAASGIELTVIALCETAAGVRAAAEIAAEPAVTALMWGAEDLIASLGGTSSRNEHGHYRHVALHARSSVLIAAGSHGKAAIDTVHLDIGDVEGLAREAQDAAASGFRASACIHPSHVPVIRASYAPSPSEVFAARQLIDEAGRHAGVFRFEGLMVDEPVLRHARAVVARSEHTVS